MKKQTYRHEITVNDITYTYIGQCGEDPRKRWYSPWGGHGYGKTRFGKFIDELKRVEGICWDDWSHQTAMKKMLDEELVDILETIEILWEKKMEKEKGDRVNLNTLLGNGLKYIGVSRKEAEMDIDETLELLKEKYWDLKAEIEFGAFGNE